MDKSFDFAALVKNHLKKHKSKPTQFASVAEGVKKRRENTVKLRKSNRLTAFDNARILLDTRSESPVPPKTEHQNKVQRRIQQLEKWKQEKERRNKEAAAKKKKPFVTGIAHNPKKYMPPPPVESKPSTSGCVTRSQSRKVEEIAKQAQTKSIAPKNATFHPPKIRNATTVPTLIPNQPKKKNFQPVLSIVQEQRPICSNTFIKKIKPTKSKVDTRSIAKLKSQVIPSSSRDNESSSSSSLSTNMQSSSENEIITLNYSSDSKSLQSSSSCETEPEISRSKTPKKSVTPKESTTQKDLISFTPKIMRNYLSDSKSLQSSSSCEIEPEISKSKTPIKSITPKESTTQKDLISFTPKNMRNYSSDSKSQQSSSSCEIEPEISKSKTLKKSVTPKESMSQKDLISFTPKNVRKSMAKASTCFGTVKVEKETVESLTPNKPVPKSESNSEEKLRSPKDVVPLTPEMVADMAQKISPCVTVSRGKDNARKEMKQKLVAGLLDEDASNMDSVIYFERQLASELERLGEMCAKWDKIYEHNILPEFVQELVRGAVGQARLLMSQRLAQFGALVRRCAARDHRLGLVTAADLAGFWDMVFMQVVNIDIRFKQLEDLQARNWLEEPAPAAVKPASVKPAPVKPASVKPAAVKKLAGNSRLKEMIAAARQAKKQDAQAPTQSEKTFEAGFFTIQSPLKNSSPAVSAPNTPRDRNCLLKAVLSSEAQKSANKASFAMLRASALGRAVECDGIAPLPQTPVQDINVSATPGRSILKQHQDSNRKANRSIKVVLFDQSDNETTPQKQPDVFADSLVSSIDEEKVEKDKGKENAKDTSTRKSELVRQDAVEEFSPVMTRSRRKSIQTPQTEQKKRTSRKKKVLEESETNVVKEKTSKRSTRSRKSVT